MTPRVLAVTGAMCALLAAACTGTPASTASPAGTGTPASPATPAPASPVHGQGAAHVGGGCGTTPLLTGAAPGWASPANPPTYLRYGLAHAGGAAAFLFGYPLLAGDSGQRSDKVLWVVRYPRGGLPLQITGHPLGAGSPVVSSTWPANSSPGEIYPSDVVAPTAGCWQFTLAWNGHKDTIDLRYVAHR